MSNIAVQRTVDDHTYTWLRVRAMHENGSGGHEYWYAATSCDNLDSYTPDERGGVQGTDRAGLLLLLPLPTTMMVLPGGWLAVGCLLTTAGCLLLLTPTTTYSYYWLLTYYYYYYLLLLQATCFQTLWHLQ
jgi:hypothetical protein